jgi:nitrate reductase molybdenum cofactor assembly chaperone NarJ/NarW
MSVAAPVSVCREAFERLAPLFAWPRDGWEERIETARAAVRRADRGAARVLEQFERAIGALDRATVETTYTSTFDLAPSCSPYLGIHVFGEDSRDRARLMVGLRMSYTAQGHELAGELPDHIFLVLAFAAHFDEEEWADLAALILDPALTKMDGLLAETTNPYRHLISTARRLGRAALEEGGRA